MRQGKSATGEWILRNGNIGPVCCSKQQMKEVVEAAGEEQPPAGVSHDLADLGAVGGMVTMARAALAGGFGVHGTAGTFDKGMHQELGAIGAEIQGPANNRWNVVGSQLDRRLGRRRVSAFAVNADEQSKGFEIAMEFGRSGHGIESHRRHMIGQDEAEFVELW